MQGLDSSSCPAMKRLRSSSPLEESRNKKILIESHSSSSSSSSMKDPTINSTPANIHQRNNSVPPSTTTTSSENSYCCSSEINNNNNNNNNNVNSSSFLSLTEIAEHHNPPLHPQPPHPNPHPHQRNNSVPPSTTTTSSSENSCCCSSEINNNNNVNSSSFLSLTEIAEHHNPLLHPQPPHPNPHPHQRNNSVPPSTTTTSSENSCCCSSAINNNNNVHSSSFLSLTEIAEHHNPPLHPQPPHPNPHPHPHPQPPPHPNPQPQPQPPLHPNPPPHPNPQPQVPQPQPLPHPNPQPQAQGPQPLPFHPPQNPPPNPPPNPLLPPLPLNALPPPPVWRICCIGATRIGTVTMMMIANFCPNVDITIVDEDLDVIHRAMQGQFMFYEPHLQQLNNHLTGLNPPRLTFTDQREQSILNAHIIFIAVGIKTKVKPPSKKGQVECSEWMRVWKYLVALQNIQQKIIVELTILPLDFETLFTSAIAQNLNTFRVILNPSFLSEGRAVEDIHNPSSVVIAYRNLEAAHAIYNLYHQWVPENSIYTTNNFQSAVLGKLGLNLLLSLRVDSINILNNMAGLWGAERSQISRIITQDYRIEDNYFQPGIGFGGLGLEKCLDHLSEAALQKGLRDVSHHFKQIIKRNESTRKRFVKKMQLEMGSTVGKRIAVLGIAYKRNTNDITNSPAVKICLELLNDEGAQIKIFDPRVPVAVTTRLFNRHQQNIEVMGDVYAACHDVDAICILTNSANFFNLNFAQIRGGMRDQAYSFIFFGQPTDIDPQVLIQMGFRVYNFGG